jgi:hypothetical protein
MFPPWVRRIDAWIPSAWVQDVIAPADHVKAVQGIARRLRGLFLTGRGLRLGAGCWGNRLAGWLSRFRFRFIGWRFRRHSISLLGLGRCSCNRRGRIILRFWLWRSRVVHLEYGSIGQCDFHGKSSGSFASKFGKLVSVFGSAALYAWFRIFSWPALSSFMCCAV